jgi:hypothetical protein
VKLQAALWGPIPTFGDYLGAADAEDSLFFERALA